MKVAAYPFVGSPVTLRKTFGVQMGYTMDCYRSMAILATVAEQGSIRRAARAVQQPGGRQRPDAAGDLGLSLHVVPEIAGDLAAGRLVRVLPDWSLPSVAVAALMPSPTRRPSKVRMAVEAIRAHLNTGPPARAKTRRAGAIRRLTP